MKPSRATRRSRDACPFHRFRRPAPKCVPRRQKSASRISSGQLPRRIRPRSQITQASQRRRRRQCIDGHHAQKNLVATREFRQRPAQRRHQFRIAGQRAQIEEDSGVEQGLGLGRAHPCGKAFPPLGERKAPARMPAITSPSHRGNPHSASARFAAWAKGRNSARNWRASPSSLAENISPLSWSLTKVCSRRPAEPRPSQHQRVGGNRKFSASNASTFVTMASLSRDKARVTSAGPASSLCKTRTTWRTSAATGHQRGQIGRSGDAGSTS